MLQLRFLVCLLCAPILSCDRNDTNQGQEAVEHKSVQEPHAEEKNSTFPHAITEEILANTRLPYFKFEDQDLNVVLQFLSDESKKYGQMVGYEPVRFRAEESLGNSKVNLSAKGNSMRLVCEMLAEQTQAELRINPHEVVFGRGVWDGIE